MSRFGGSCGTASNSNGSNKSQMKQWDEREQRQELSSITNGRLREDTVTPLILAAQAKPVQRDIAAPAGALSSKKGNAANHKGGLVHHAVHFPQSHRGGMVHETQRGPRPNSGSDGMISGGASSAGDEDVTSDVETMGGD